jgi:hypothetical protein
MKEDRQAQAAFGGPWLAPALIFLSVLAVLKGLHRPDRWGATQMETDYSVGFIKRGLFGEVLRQLHVNHYNQLVVLSIACVFLFVVQLGILAYRRLYRLVGSPWIGGVMMTSFGLTYLVSLGGHLEIFLAVIALAALAISPGTLFIATAIVATVLGLFVHELFLLVFVPIFALRLLLDAAVSSEKDITMRGLLFSRKSIGLILLLAVALATSLLLSATPSLTPEKITLLRQSMQARLDFAPREWIFAVFARDIGDNLRIMAETARTSRYWISQAESAMVFGPATLLFLGISLRRLQSWQPGNVRNLLRAAIIIASLSPLTLHLLGWDIFRFNALVVLTSFLAMVLVLAALHDVKQPPILILPVSWSYAAALLIALNLGSGTGLLDDQQVQLFPQIQLLRYGMQDASAILRHRPLAIPYEPWKEWPWDPSRPKYSGLQCLDDCGPPSPTAH